MAISSAPPGGFADAFEQLDATLPLLLLPVRIETLFDIAAAPTDGGAADPAQRRDLLIRIYPDLVHVDAHVRTLARPEMDLGQRFWEVAWSAGPADAEPIRAFRRLASRVVPFRAAWILEATRPLNWNTRGDGQSGRGPEFAQPTQRTGATPGRARLLPEHWIVTGYQNLDLVFTQRGAVIPRDLAVTPDIAAPSPAPKDTADLIERQGLAWLRDFAAAEQVGMALRVPLAKTVDLQRPLDLIVVGVRADGTPAATADEFADLLAAHHWTRGVDFVRRGTPTNNSDRVNSGVSLSRPNLPDLLDSVLASPHSPDDQQKAPLFRSRFYAAARLALGLQAGSILDRVALRDDAQLDLAASMNAALWPATWGQFLRSMVAGALTDPWIDWARGHFILNIRGGGLLPTIRLGDQPYGLHPVSAELARDSPRGNVEKLGNLLLRLLPAWSDAVEQRVASLDPDATDRPAGGGSTASPGDATATLARILGATPNPSDLMATPATNQIGLYQLKWGLNIFLLDAAISPHFPEISADLGVDLDAAPTLEQQIAALEGVISDGGANSEYPAGALFLAAHLSTNDQPTRDAAQSAIDFIKADMLPILYNHRDRSLPLLDLGPDRTQVTGLMADDTDPPLFFTFFGEDAERVAWTGPLVADDPSDADKVRTWLKALATEAGDASKPAQTPGEHPPLLFQLFKRAISNVHDADRADMVAGIDNLAAAAADGRIADPVADLETLMGETLGTCMHRIDAWLSGAAADALADLRRKQPEGIQVGGFGWVLNLLPTRAATPSQGFIHAPSPDHAAVAAILRSGWDALGDGALALDLSSDRARAACWMIDGVRDGVSLGELLGQALERRLHDAYLDRWVEPLRSAVLTATGEANQPPSAIVDGFIVARAWIGGDSIAPLTDAETSVRRELDQTVRGAGSDATALRAVLNAHATDLEAVADAEMFQAVWAVVRGNPDAASAALAVAGGEAAAPPPLDALRTVRGGRRVSHRVLLLIDGTGGMVATDSPDAIVEPNLEAWLSSVLPLGQIVFGAWVEENGATSWQGPYDLAAQGLGALGFLADQSSGSGTAANGSLARRLAWRLERDAAAAGRMVRASIDGDLDGRDVSGKLPLNLALTASHSLAGLLHAARAADNPDVAAAAASSTADPSLVTERASALSTAAGAVAAKLRTTIDSAAPTGDLLDACAALAAWRVPGAIPTAGLVDLATGANGADRTALLAEAEALHGRMTARIEAQEKAVGGDLAAALARIQALLPGAIVLPPFMPANNADLRQSAARSDARLGPPETALPWLHHMGRVRERVQLAADAVDLLEAAIGTGCFRPSLIQFPDDPEDGWAATTLPNADAGPRACILSLTPMPASDQLAGLAIDAWTEVIPDNDVTTGIAVHFDSPSARAPQTWLLATPPTDGPWTFDDVLARVRQTVDRARQRAVGPEQIEGFGQYLPSTYLSDTTDPGPAAAPAEEAKG